jgi:hypothetical protein
MIPDLTTAVAAAMKLIPAPMSEHARPNQNDTRLHDGSSRWAIKMSADSTTRVADGFLDAIALDLGIVCARWDPPGCHRGLAHQLTELTSGTPRAVRILK